MKFTNLTRIGRSIVGLTAAAVLVLGISVATQNAQAWDPASATAPVGYTTGWYQDAYGLGPGPSSSIMTFGATTPGAGVTQSIVQLQQNSILRVSGVGSRTYAAATTNNDYLWATFTANSTWAPNGYRMIGYRFKPNLWTGTAQSSGARLQVAVYDSAGTKISDVGAPQVTAATSAYISVAGTSALLQPNTTYQLRFYVYTSSGTVVELDNMEPLFEARQVTSVSKTWVGARVNDTATLTATGGTPTPVTLNSVANTPSETDVSALADVTAGNSVNYTETTTAGNLGTYSTTRSCTVLNSSGATSAFTPPRTVLASDRTLNCTYTNQGTGTIVIKKDAIPDGATAFSYTSSITGNPSFQLTDNGTASNTRTMPGIKAGSYTVTESALPAGWTLSNLSCVDSVSTGGTASTVSGSTATINLDAGETVTCTYVNSQSATLTVQKSALGGGTSFPFSISGATTQSFALNPPANGGSISQTFTNIPANTNLTISELVAGFPSNFSLYDVSCTNTGGSGGTPTGMNLVGASASIPANRIGGSVTGQLAPGANVTCTFTNTENVTGTVFKYATGGDGIFNYDVVRNGTSLGTVPVTTTGGVGSAVQSFASTGTNVPFSVTEQAIAGWVLTNIQCTQTGGPAGGLESVVYDIPNRRVTGTVDAGTEMRCDYYNVKLPTVYLQKTAVGAGGPFNFTGGTNGLPATASAVLASAGTTAIGSATGYTVTSITQPAVITESTPPAGFTLESVVCRTGSFTGTTAATTVSGSTLTIPATTLDDGNDLYCTFTNTKKPTLQLIKSVINDNGGTATSANWTLSASGLTPVTNVASGTTTTVEPGTYALSESSGPGGYIASPYSCQVNGGAAVSGNSITLSAGNVAVCTITNNDSNETSLSILKSDAQTSVPAGSQVTYNIVINNSGPASASGATFTETPVSGLTNCSVTGSSSMGGASVIPTGSAIAAAGTNFTIAAMPANSSTTVQVTCTATP